MSEIYDITIRTDRLGQKLGGGLPVGSLTYLEGGDGAGKSILSQRIGYSLCENGYTVSYITPELNASKFISQMDSLNYTIVDHMIVSEDFKFFTADVETTERLRYYDTESRYLISELINPSYSTVWSSDVIIIDSFDILLQNDPRFDELDSKSDQMKAMENVFKFISSVTDSGSSVIITADESNVSSELFTVFQSRSDCYLSIDMVNKSGEIQRAVNVNRYNLAEKEVADIINFRVQAKTGVIIETKVVV